MSLLLMNSSKLENGKSAIVFDLNETLIHQTKEETRNSFKIEINQNCVNILIRKGAINLLKELNNFYDLFIFTSAKKEYADPIINLIAPHIQKKNRLYRESIKFIDKNPIKDLKLIKKNISKVLLIDDRPKNAMMQPKNVVGVKEFWGEFDSVLVDLLPVLKSIALENNHFFNLLIIYFFIKDNFNLYHCLLINMFFHY